MADGARCVEFVELCDVGASRHACSNAQNSQSNQPHAPDGGRGFYLAIRGSCLLARKRPNLARLSESAVSFQIGFSRTWEDLRWHLGPG